MKFTPEERQGITEALQAAKPFLWDGQDQQIEKHISEFICIALLNCQHPSSSVARQVVSSRLYPHISIYFYLIDEVRVRRSRLTEKAVQTFRHAWVDELIREFSEPISAPTASS